MAITIAQNKSRVMKKIMSVIHGISNEADKPVGAAVLERIMGRVWTNAGAPSGAAPTGMSAGDLILDTTNDEVYRYITGTTYVNMTADS